MIQGKPVYSIRESYLKDGVYLSRNLVELEGNPRLYVRYPQGRSFYIDSRIEDALRTRMSSIDYDDLERIFWPFVHPEVLRRYGADRSRDTRDSLIGDLSHVHMFDKRRLSYLRTGSMNQRHIDKAPATLFQPLSGKSRDELEQKFMADESRLKEKEIKSYVFVIFDLQRHFNTLFAREMPQALDPGQVEEHFLGDICSLNRDNRFWSGMAMQPFLHDYLTRYLIMFFDMEYRQSRFMEDLEFARFNQRRYYRQTQRPLEEVYREAGLLFGVSGQELKRMSKRDLQRIYRKKARELHPDHGGSHENFISLSRIYEELMAKRS